MNLLTPVKRPEYFFRPSQIWRRLSYSVFGAGNGQPIVRLPWGASIQFNAKDRWIGRALLTTGLDDLPLCETLWRLLERGDFAVDVGANIGMTASLMLVRVGPEGSVHAFEPHPRTHELLTNNARMWGGGDLPKNLRLYACAVGATGGRAALEEPEDWERNSGGVSVRPAEVNPEVKWTHDPLAVDVFPLDERFPSPTRLGLVKVDVEGRQDDVLRGAESLLNQQRIRDLIFEIPHETSLPYAMTDWLETLGYRCFVINWLFGGPTLCEIRSGVSRVQGHMTNVLATADSARAMALIAERGWRCLRASR